MIQRFQLYFPVDLYLRLKDAAARHGTSIADYVRQAAERALAGETAAGPDPLDRIVGKARSGYKDLARRHDAYLYGLVKDAPARRRRRRP
jgi:plasmid stability protein